MDIFDLLLLGCLSSLGLGMFVGSLLHLQITIKRGEQHE